MIILCILMETVIWSWEKSKLWVCGKHFSDTPQIASPFHINNHLKRRDVYFYLVGKFILLSHFDRFHVFDFVRKDGDSMKLIIYKQKTRKLSITSCITKSECVPSFPFVFVWNLHLSILFIVFLVVVLGIPFRTLFINVHLTLKVDIFFFTSYLFFFIFATFLSIITLTKQF